MVRQPSPAATVTTILALAVVQVTTTIPVVVVGQRQATATILVVARAVLAGQIIATTIHGTPHRESRRRVITIARQVHRTGIVEATIVALLHRRHHHHPKVQAAHVGRDNRV